MSFLEIHLISSRIDQKFENRGEIHGFLKGESAQIRGQYRRSWVLINGILGAVPWGDVVASIPLQFGGEFGFNFASIGATIAPRLGVDRDVGAQTIAFRICGKARGLDFAS